MDDYDASYDMNDVDWDEDHSGMDSNPLKNQASGLLVMSWY